MKSTFGGTLSAARLRWSAAFLLGAGVTSATLAAAPSEDVGEHIRRVEHGLIPATVIRGQPMPALELSNRMAFYHVPGVSIAVINHGEIEWARGYGETEARSGRPVTADTIFQAASISKPVAAMAALKFVQEGNLDLDEDVNHKLSSWKVPENQFTKNQKVTLRRLVSHSAGLTVHGFRGYAAGEPVPSLRQVLDGAKPANSNPIRVFLVPGAQNRYSGGGFCVLQQLLCDVAGRPFPQILNEAVIRPLAMEHSGYYQPLPETLSTNAAAGHGADGKVIPGRWHTYPEMAAAGLWTTPSDLARFTTEIQRARAGESARVISSEMTWQMLTTQVGDTGLGVALSGEGPTRRFSHGGANDGFRAFWVGYFETGQGVVVMANSDSGDGLNEEVLRAVAREYRWPNYRPRERAIVPVEASQIERYAGTYKLLTNMDLTLSARQGHLFVQATGQQA